MHIFLISLAGLFFLWLLSEAALWLWPDFRARRRKIIEMKQGAAADLAEAQKRLRERIARRQSRTASGGL